MMKCTLRYTSDLTPAILTSFIITSWPKENIFKKRKYEPLLNWKYVHVNFPWNTLFLLGGSIALANGCEVIFLFYFKFFFYIISI